MPMKFYSDPKIWKSKSGCPRLFLAPMEGLGDAPFRLALSKVGGFDEATTEFIRVPKNAHVCSLAKVYDPHLTAPIPQAAQIMGSDPALMAAMAWQLERRGAPRIDINCGCPSNVVVGRHAGSSLLKVPSHLGKLAAAVVGAVKIPVSLKMRTGFEDTSLFEDNVLAAQSAGISFLTLHARTKVDGYKPPAYWEYIARAKQLLSIPLIGNGEIWTVEDARRMLQETGCDGLMVGRGAAADPWIFHKIRASFGGAEPVPSEQFLEDFFAANAALVTEKVQINKLKQICRYLFGQKGMLNDQINLILRAEISSPRAFLDQILAEYRLCLNKFCQMSYK